MAQAAVRTQGRRAAQGSRRVRELPGLQLRYYKRMTPNRVYAVSVGWEKNARRTPAAPVTLRLVMAGAQVVPAEQPLNPNNPKANVTFFVTPLAKGWMRNERLEVVSNGKKVDEVLLKCKAVTQRPAWVFLLLAFLIPWLMLSLCKYSPLSNQPSNGRQNIETDASQAGSVLKSRIEREVPRLTDAVDNEQTQKAQKVLDSFWDKVAEGYQQMIQWIGVEDQPIPFFTCVAFLFLAFMSWWFRSNKTKKRRTDPIQLG